MVSENCLGISRKGHKHTALDQSALLQLLGELKLTDIGDRVRVATDTLYQELIDAEAAAFIGAAPYEPDIPMWALATASVKSAGVLRRALALS